MFLFKYISEIAQLEPPVKVFSIYVNIFDT